MFKFLKERVLTAFLVVGLMLAAATASAVPEFAKHLNRYVGAVISYVVNTGAETSVDIVYDGVVPFRLTDVTATVDGVATNVVIKRVFNYVRDYEITEVITNFYGNLETNVYPSGTVRFPVTNTVYDSTSDTLPVTAYFLSGEKLLAEVDDTNTIVRIVGTSQ